jgi:L-serine dehydratase
MNLFDIIGPVMIGPSSSHTAGAVRIGGVSGRILGEAVQHADIELAGSFAETYRGHGTDKALVAGLLGMFPDNPDIKRSFDIAAEQGMTYAFIPVKLPHAHPNTARITMTGVTGKTAMVQGASVGGGNILITAVNHTETAFTGNLDTLIIVHDDIPGVIAEVTTLLARMGINISTFKLSQSKRKDEAVMTLEIDDTIGLDSVKKIKALEGITNVIHLRANLGERF